LPDKYHPDFEQYSLNHQPINKLKQQFSKHKDHIMRNILASLIFIVSLLGSAAAYAGPKVEFKTTMGNFVVELDSVAAPKSTANFLSYVNSGFYNGTIFHRVIDGFMIQGGGFTPDLVQKPTNAPVASEAQNGLKNQTYTIAMARTSDPDSATAQFFINVNNNEGLNYPNAMGNGYTVFGKVISGTQTIDAIRKIPTMIASTPKTGRMSDVPSKMVTIESATVLK
jgi:peptidyl-prolyl cis-trans isomerase A (cyclophilin A)